jgi:hypothetical protein
MQAENEKVPPIAVTVREACRLVGLGTTTLYKLIAAGRLQVRRAPNVDRTLIDYGSLKQLLATDPSSTAKMPPPRRPRGRPRGRRRKQI